MPTAPATPGQIAEKPAGSSYLDKVLPANFDLGAPDANTKLVENMAKADGKAPPPAKEIPKVEPIVPAKVEAPVVPAVVPEARVDEPEPTDDPKLESLAESLGLTEKPKAPPTDAVDPAAALNGKLPTQPAVEDTIPEELPPQAKAAQKAFATVTRQNKELKAKVKELESKGSIDVAAQASEPLRQEIASLQQQRDQLLAGMAQTKLELRPDIQQQIIKPMDAAEKFIRETAQTADLSAGELLAAAREPDRAKRVTKVRELCTDLHPSDQLRVEQAVDAINILGTALEQKRATALQDNAAAEQRNQQQLLAQQAQFRQEAVKTFDTTFNELLASDPVLSSLAKNDPEVAKEMTSVLDMAKKIDASDYKAFLNHRTRGQLFMQAIALPIVTKRYQGVLREYVGQVKALKAENLKLKNAGLSTDRRGGSAPAQQTERKTAAQLIAELPLEGRR
jgi:hypothetical protein